MKRRDKGFTLVELIVVIVIIAILVGVTLIGVTSQVTKAKRNTDINNAATISRIGSLMLMDQEFNEFYYLAQKHAYDIEAYQDMVFPYYITWTNASYFSKVPDDGLGKNYKIGLANKLAEYFTEGMPESKTGDGFMLVFQWNVGERRFESIKCYSLAEYDITADTMYSYHDLIKSRTGNSGTILDTSINSTHGSFFIEKDEDDE